jgi:hypothetical protein
MGVIAHVHVDNDKPISLLTTQLGFSLEARGNATIAKAVLEQKFGHPINMRADERGMICGDTYRFSPAYLAQIADRIANGRLAKVDVQIDALTFGEDDREFALGVLRELASH